MHGCHPDRHRPSHDFRSTVDRERLRVIYCTEMDTPLVAKAVALRVTVAGHWLRLNATTPGLRGARVLVDLYRGLAYGPRKGTLAPFHGPT